MGFIDPHVLHAATHVIVPSARPQDFGIEYNIFRTIFHYDFQLHQLVKRLNLEKQQQQTKQKRQTNKQNKQTNKNRTVLLKHLFFYLPRTDEKGHSPIRSTLELFQGQHSGTSLGD